jgi:BirA family biotin operon repressor/biotin-[acetyl-CoA-carboxylase] ligase
LNLNPQSLFVGQSVIFVQEVDSTNTYLKSIVKRGNVAEGAVVVTDYQSSGKGQRGNGWQSNARLNGLFSCLLQPKHLRPDQLSTMSFLISLAVRATVQKYAPDKDVTVKWPNDIMVDDKKVAGILIENSLGQPIASIVGIGLNINQQHFDQLPHATSLLLETGNKYDVAQIVSECLTFVEKYYLLTKRAGGVKQLWNLYVSQLYKHDDTVMLNGEAYKVMGVKETGELIVSNNDGERFLQHKEVDIQWN